MLVVSVASIVETWFTLEARCCLPESHRVTGLIEI